MSFSIGRFNKTAHLFRGRSREFFKKHGSTIRTTGICIGVVWTAVEAVKATPKACMAYEDAKMWCEQNNVPFSIIRKLEACGKYYIKPVVIGGLTIGLAIYNEKTNLKTVAGLSAALKEAEKVHKEFVEAATEGLGPKKKAEIEEKIAQNEGGKLTKPIDEADVIHTGYGDQLFYDAFGTGRYFRSSLEALRRAEAEFSLRLIQEDYLALNEWFEMIGLPTTDLGDTVGWTSRDSFSVRYIAVTPSYGPETYTKITFEMSHRPRYGFDCFSDTM